MNKRRNITTFVLTILLFVLKFNTVNGQSLNFSVTSQELGLIYQNESDFETPRIIPNAIRLNINNSRGRIIVSARTVSNLNYSFATIPTDVYSIELSNSSVNVQPSFRRLFNLDFPDTNILIHNSRGNSVSYYDYDLHVAPVGFEQEPGQYFYSIIFSVTEQ